MEQASAMSVHELLAAQGVWHLTKQFSKEMAAQ